MAGAALNLALNFLLIPRWGMMGAAWATAAAFLLIALCTGAIAQRYYAVDYEYHRLGKVWLISAIILYLGTLFPPEVSAFSIAWHLALGVLAFPLALSASGFLDDHEKETVRGLLRRYARFAAR